MKNLPGAWIRGASALLVVSMLLVVASRIEPWRTIVTAHATVVASALAQPADEAPQEVVEVPPEVVETAPDVVETPQAADQTDETADQPATETVQDEPDFSTDEPLFSAGRPGRPIVRIGQDFRLDAGDRAREVVVVLGSATIAGEVDRDVVVVLGSARLEPGAVVNGSLIVTAGEVTIGEGAVVRRELIVSAGAVNAPPDFSPGGEYVVVGIPAGGIGAEGLTTWLRSGLLWGRLVVPSLPWVWLAAAVAVFFYLLINLLGARGVKACADVVNARPLSAFFTGLLVLILIAPVSTILAISVIGIPVIPFLLCGLLVAALVGKVGVSRWLGSGIVPETDPDDRAQATRSFLIGSAIIIGAYMVPVVGILAWMVGSTFGLGAATLAFSSGLRREMPPRPLTPPAPPPPGPYPGPAPQGSMPASAPPPPAVYSAPPDVSTSTPAWESGAPTFDSEAAAFQETAPPAPPPVPPVTPPPPAAVAFDPAMASLLPKAQFLDRLGAFVIDILLVLVLQAFLDVGTFRGFVTLLLGYHILFWALKQTTVGGMILNLRVVRTDGQPLTFADALIRGLVSILSVAALGLGCFWILFDPDNQAWHDRFAGTWVVKAPR